jgi:hypothetical protein
MPTIEIDDEVMALLKQEAEPFVDTPNSVLRRLVGLGSVNSELPPHKEEPISKAVVPRGKSREGRRKKGRAKGPSRVQRAPRGVLLPETEYEVPILTHLVQEGGRAPSREVVAAVGEQLADRLTDADRGTLSSGGIRWEKRVAFARLRMIEAGLLDGQAPRGTWAITDKGRKRLEKS